MASNPPYAARYGQQQQPTQYTDYEPYAARPQYEQQPYQTYEPEPYNVGEEYRDEPFQPPSNLGASGEKSEVTKEKVYGSAFGDNNLNSYSGKEKTAKNLKQWRYDHQGNLWTAGTRGKCVGRFCCCSTLITLFLFISILLPLILWARPPDISINDVGAPVTGSAIQLQNDGLSINLGVNVSVQNPNYFSVTFKKIEAEIFYPIDNTPIGSGQQVDLVFSSHETTNFTFPFSITYKQSLDPSNKILADLATKCGFLGTPKSNIKVNYKITLGLRILFITISPSVSNSFSFECPLKESDIQGLLGSAGMTVGGLIGAGSGGSTAGATGGGAPAPTTAAGDGGGGDSGN